MQVAQINDNGIKQISEALGKYHKLGRDHFTPSMLQVWARDAENAFENGNRCFFEIRNFDAIGGATVEVTISNDGYDLIDETKGEA
jgi:hypothetical protein